MKRKLYIENLENWWSATMTFIRKMFEAMFMMDFFEEDVDCPKCGCPNYSEDEECIECGADLD